MTWRSTILILTLLAAAPGSAESKGRMRVGCSEHAVTVPGPVPLPGKLCRPDGKGHFPGVVILAGSGPQDADGTLAPNHPLRDLAAGLCARGVASLRFDKRTQVAPKTPIATVTDEVVADAQAALHLLASQAGVDRVFVLGHDFGGFMAPRVAGGQKVEGLILLGVSARSLSTQLVDQAQGMLPAGSDGKLAPMVAEQVAAAKRARQEIERPDLKATDVVDVYGVPTPASYWLDLRGYDPIAAATALGKPMLVLFAGHDELVTAADRERWGKSFAGSAKVTTRTFTGLNHLFLPAPAGKPGKAGAVEDPYSVPGTVPAEVIDAIADWVKK